MYLVWTPLIIIALGILVRFAAPRIMASSYGWKDVRKLTAGELVLGMVIIALPVMTAVGTVFAKVSVNDQLTFNEYWNGYEVAATREVTTCRKNGSCKNTYACDPIHHTHTRSVTRTRADGSTYSDTETYSETHWSSCPYTSEEWSFYIDTSLGSYTVASNVLPENPTAHYWRKPGAFGGGDRISESMKRSAGYPARWIAARDRLKAGLPGPVTKVNPYKNYLLASDRTIFAKYEGEIKDYKKQGVMPSPARGVNNIYRSEKFHTIGLKTGKEWNTRLELVNAMLGGQKEINRRGDLHVVAVDANKVGSFDKQAYIETLMAYWQSDEHGRDAIAKNTIVVVLGVKDNMIEWSAAATAMPMGNEGLINNLERDLEGLGFTPDILFGIPTKVRAGSRPSLEGGAIKTMLLTGPDAFERPCMECNDKGENKTEGFAYLKGDVKPTGAAMVWAAIVSILIASVMWVILWNINLHTVPVVGRVVSFIDNLVGDNDEAN